MTFSEINKHIIPMNEFSLKWRFTEEEYDILPETDLNELKPLNKVGAEFINDYLSSRQIHSEIPFKKGLFRNLDRAKILNENEEDITKWLYESEIPFDKEVYLSWDNETGMITKWEYIVKYWDSLYYSASDDLTIFDQNLEWIMLFFHEDEIYFGTNNEYISKNEFEDNDFCYSIK
ncbi:DUF2947 family protein [Tenacibaculum finnmarkense genomovar ulcerans]|uniref:DUF2947 family protein n=1 Tax=Tenacibaculum finnmarkense TaxID=2781243 RepID=UPI00187B72B7|nr:DUF2947 family protein [Tenacibaculum finnmarkense]MBE7689025.1 DUF2947 family protein [Tenacibaculum finnmarkense genomovar ulcerans]